MLLENRLQFVHERPNVRLGQRNSNLATVQPEPEIGDRLELASGPALASRDLEVDRLVVKEEVHCAEAAFQGWWLIRGRVLRSRRFAVRRVKQYGKAGDGTEELASIHQATTSIVTYSGKRQLVTDLTVELRLRDSWTVMV